VNIMHIAGYLGGSLSLGIRMEVIIRNSKVLGVGIFGNDLIG